MISVQILADFYTDDQQVMATGVAIRNKLELVPSADGSLDWLSTTKIPLFGNTGAVIGIAGVARLICDSDSVYAGHPEMHLIVAYVRQHYREKISVSDLAEIGGISVSCRSDYLRKPLG